MRLSWNLSAQPLFQHAAHFLDAIPWHSMGNGLLQQAVSWYQPLIKWIQTEEIPLFIKAQDEPAFRQYQTWRSNFKKVIWQWIKAIETGKGISPKNFKEALLLQQEQMAEQGFSPYYYATYLEHIEQKHVQVGRWPKGYGYALQEARARLEEILRAQPAFAHERCYDDIVNAVIAVSGQQANSDILIEILKYYASYIEATVYQAVLTAIQAFIALYPADIQPSLYTALPYRTVKALLDKINHVFAGEPDSLSAHQEYVQATIMPSSYAKASGLMALAALTYGTMSRYDISNLSTIYLLSGVSQIGFSYTLNGFTTSDLMPVTSLGIFMAFSAWPVTQAQAINTTTFFRTFGGNDEDYISAASSMVNGGMLIAGTSSASSAIYNYILVAKLDNNGELLWARTLGNHTGASAYVYANAALGTADSGAIIAGYKTINGDVSGVTDDISVSKFDSSGKLLWAQALGGNNGDCAKAAFEAADGAILIAGYTASFGAGGYDALMIQLDNSGNVLWAQTFGGSNNDYAYAAFGTTDGGMLIVGATASFSVGDYDALVVKLNNSGNLLWAQTLGGIYYDAAGAACESADGGIVITGRTTSFGGYRDAALVAKLDSNGNLLWARILEGIYYEAKAAACGIDDTHVIIVGLTALNTYQGGYAAFMAMFAGSGNLAWARSLGEGNNNDFFTTAYKTADDSTLIVGSTGSFGTGSLDALVIKLNMGGGLPGCSYFSNIGPIVSSPDIATNRPMLKVLAITSNLTLPWSPSLASIDPIAQTLCPNQVTTSQETMDVATTSVTEVNSTLSNNTTLIASLAAGAVALTLCISGGASFWYVKRRQRLAKAQLQARESEMGIEMVEGVRKEKGHTVIYGKQAHYALLNKITTKDARALKAQTGIEVAFLAGKNKTKFELGRGQFGKLRLAKVMALTPAVDKAPQPQVGDFVGVKKIKGKKEIELSQTEAALQLKLSGKAHIMPLLESIETKGSQGQPVLYQFMPLAGFGNGETLQKALALVADPTEKLRILVHVAKGLLTGLANMQDSQIYHLDMKPSNMVLSKDGDVSVIDFGCAQHIADGQLSHGNGDSRYYAPERLEQYRQASSGQHYVIDAGKVDAWAAGVTLLQLAMNQYPWEIVPASERLAKWDAAYFARQLAKIEVLANAAPKTYWALVKGLLAPDPAQRLSIEEALNAINGLLRHYAFASLEAQQVAFEELKEWEKQAPRVSISLPPTAVTEQEHYPAYGATQQAVREERRLSGAKEELEYEPTPARQAPGASVSLIAAQPLAPAYAYAPSPSVASSDPQKVDSATNPLPRGLATQVNPALTRSSNEAVSIRALTSRVAFFQPAPEILREPVRASQKPYAYLPSSAKQEQDYNYLPSESYPSKASGM